MCRSLWGAHLHRTVLEQCEVVIAEVNDQLPTFVTEGERHLMVHVSEVDAIVESSRPPAENVPVPAAEEDRRIAGHIAELVPDGACMQFGLGGLANAVGDCLAYAGKKDLGIHTEVMTSCVAELMRKGVVNNSRKTLLPGRSVGAFLVGDRALWDYVENNPAFCFREIDWVNDPRNIAQNDRVVSVNNAMEVDLTGQVNAESIGPRMYSGTGGQLEWVMGAQWSREGKSIIALRSSYVDKSGVRHSKIKPRLTPGGVVTTPRTFVQYVVTEYGVADLKYKSCRERARALIAIAHPDFRKELERDLPL
jgi:acyl-CoA hydrolase